MLPLATLALGCAVVAPPIDPGTVRGGTWRSAEFALAATPPPGWAFVPNDQIERRLAAQASALPRTLRNSKGMRAGATPLFAMVDRAHAPAPGRARRALFAHAQRMPNAPAGTTSEALAAELARALLSLELPIEIGTRRHAIVAGRHFVVVPTALTHAGISGRVDHFLRYESQRLLVLTVSYPPEEFAPPQPAIEALRPIDRPAGPEEP